MDRSDPYTSTELEDDGDGEDTGDGEPSLRSLGSLNQTRWSDGSGDDAERDDSDSEPSLGFLERHPSTAQAWVRIIDQWSGQLPEQLCAGLNGDREQEHDGTEPSEDDKPPLGSVNQRGFGDVSQEHWACGVGTNGSWTRLRAASATKTA